MSKKPPTREESHYMVIVASLGCVITRRNTGQIVSCDVHHIAEGSGKRSHFRTAGLSKKFHTDGGTGLHAIGIKKFLMAHDLPNEYELMELVNRFRMEDGV